MNISLRLFFHVTLLWDCFFVIMFDELYFSIWDSFALLLAYHVWSIHISSDVFFLLFICDFDKMKNAVVQYANTCYKNVTFSG